MIYVLCAESQSAQNLVFFIVRGTKSSTQSVFDKLHLGPSCLESLRYETNDIGRYSKVELN